LTADGLGSEHESTIEHAILLPGTLPRRRAMARQGVRISLISVCRGYPGPVVKREGALEAFAQACGRDRTDVWLLLVNLDEAPPPVGRSPIQAIGRDRRSTPFPSSTIRSGRLFLGGLLASIARLRFADNASIKLLPDRKEAFIIGRKQCLNCLCQPTGQAHPLGVNPKTETPS